MVKVGSKFVGSVDGTIFEVIEFRESRKNVGLRPDYLLSYGNGGKTVSATQSLLHQLLKSGGLVVLGGE